jgi:hypothetical protein
MLVKVGTDDGPGVRERPGAPAQKVVDDLAQVTVVLFNRIRAVVIGPGMQDGQAHHVDGDLAFPAGGEPSGRVIVPVPAATRLDRC